MCIAFSVRAVCRLICVGCCLWFVDCCLVFVGGCLVFGFRCVKFIMCCGVCCLLMVRSGVCRMMQFVVVYCLLHVASCCLRCLYC